MLLDVIRRGPGGSEIGRLKDDGRSTSGGPPILVLGIRSLESSCPGQMERMRTPRLFGVSADGSCCHLLEMAGWRRLLVVACRWVLMLGLDRTVAGFLLWTDDESLAFDAVEMLLKDFAAADRCFRP
ncbi:hypothetical protein ACLOJK_021017 [Asimina triloba]